MGKQHRDDRRPAELPGQQFPIVNHDMVIVSVAICTYNRANVLAETLASFADRHGRCRAQFELVVVDNNSTDATAAVVAAFARAHPRMPLICVHERRQGLSHARNRAAAEASGEIIVYCDDDVFFDSNVVDVYADAFGADPSLVAAAGRIDPHFEVSRPAWLADNMLGPYSITNYGDVQRPLGRRELPVGANMAIRRQSVLACGGFSPRLGRDGKSLLSGEENLLFAQLRREGGVLVYLPAARVRHRIPAQRLTQQWLVERWFWAGISDAVVESEAATFSRTSALWGAWEDLRKVVRLLRPRSLDPIAWYWQLRRPGISIAPDVAYRWGRARGRVTQALTRRL